MEVNENFPDTVKEHNIDYTTYPDGFEAALDLLDFLPDDHAQRRRFLNGLTDTLCRR